MSAKNIKIFIASAGEMAAEREKAIMLTNALQKVHRHLHIEPVEWEYDTQRGNQPGHSNIQAAINPKLEASHIVVFIFYTRLGYCTKQEFDLANKLAKKYFALFKKGFSPNNKTEIEAYSVLLDFKETLNETVSYDHFDDADGFYNLMYQRLNLYLSETYPADIDFVTNAPLSAEVTTLIKLLGEKEERIKQLEALTPVLATDNEVAKLKTEIDNIKAELAQSETLRQQQALDKAVLEEQLAAQKGNDQLKAQALEAVEKRDYATAETLLKESARVSMATTATTFFELAKIKKLQLQYREAFDYYELAVKIEPDNSFYLNEAGVMADTLGYINKALLYYEQSLPLTINEFGGRHPIIAVCYNNLGLAYHGKGEHDKAIGYYEQALDINKKFYSEQHPEIAICYNNLGTAYHDKGEHDKAIGYYEQALDIGREFYGEWHPSIATCYNNLGSAYDDKGEHDKAIGYYEQALDINKALYGERHPEIAIRYNNLGTAYDDKSEHDKAIGYYEQALDIDRAFYGEQHPTIAIRYNNLGGAYRSKGEYDKAIGYYEQALDINKAFYGERHPKIAVRYNNLGSTYDSKGEYDEAIRYFEQALDIWYEFFPPEHPNIKRVQQNLQLAKEAKNKQAE